MRLRLRFSFPSQVECSPGNSGSFDVQGQFPVSPGSVGGDSGLFSIQTQQNMLKTTDNIDLGEWKQT